MCYRHTTLPGLAGRHRCDVLPQESPRQGAGGGGADVHLWHGPGYAQHALKSWLASCVAWATCPKTTIFMCGCSCGCGSPRPFESQC